MTGINLDKTELNKRLQLAAQKLPDGVTATVKFLHIAPPDRDDVRVGPVLLDLGFTFADGVTSEINIITSVEDLFEGPKTFDEIFTEAVAMICRGEYRIKPPVEVHQAIDIDSAGEAIVREYTVRNN